MSLKMFTDDSKNDLTPVHRTDRWKSKTGGEVTTVWRETHTDLPGHTAADSSGCSEEDPSCCRWGVNPQCHRRTAPSAAVGFRSVCCCSDVMGRSRREKQTGELQTTSNECFSRSNPDPSLQTGFDDRTGILSQSCSPLFFSCLVTLILSLLIFACLVTLTQPLPVPLFCFPSISTCPGLLRPPTHLHCMSRLWW